MSENRRQLPAHWGERLNFRNDVEITCVKMLCKQERHTTRGVSLLHLQGQTSGIIGYVKNQLSVSEKELYQYKVFVALPMPRGARQQLAKGVLGYNLPLISYFLEVENPGKEILKTIQQKETEQKNNRSFKETIANIC